MSMHVTLTRNKMDSVCTEGELLIDGKHYAAALEDPQRKTKIWGKTCIPASVYSLSVVLSPHFGRRVVMICDVPNYSCVYIHSGMTAADTDGCVLIADKEIALDTIGGNSKMLMDNLTSLVLAALSRGEHCDIEIKEFPSYL